MKIDNVLIHLLIVTSILMISCKEEKKEKINTSTVEKALNINDTLNNLNHTKVIQKENIYEINQRFLKKNEESNIIGDIVEVDLTTTSGAMISAYSKYVGDYSIFFRTFEKNVWSNWIKLKENEDVKNPNRQAFHPKSLNNFVTQIQFKSDRTIEKEIIFRIFTFK